MGSFLLYSVHEGIRGIPLDPNDKSDALVPVSGTSWLFGIDFHAGEPRWQEGVTWPSFHGEVFWGTRERLPDHSCPTLLCRPKPLVSPALSHPLVILTSTLSLPR